MHFRKNIISLDSYKPPLANRVKSGMHLLDFNERSTPLSSKILKKLEGWCVSGLTHIYPDYSGLIEKIAAYNGANVENIFLGNGSDQIIDTVMRAVLDETQTIVLPKPSFAMFAQLARLTGARIDYYDLLAEDPLLELENKLKSKPRMVILCQPNNPTGCFLDPKRIETLINKHTETWFFIDEAYFEYSGCSQLEISQNLENLVISRTFSKAFGLAALRLGYMVSSEKMNENCSKIRGPYDINQFACFAGQVVLDHVDEIQGYCNEVMNINKPKIEAALTANNISFRESKANFINIYGCNELAEHLLKKNILARKMSQPELKDSFRLSIGDGEVTDLTLQGIESYLNK
jgi:histidinol-phosphate aminotransferase